MDSSDKDHSLKNEDYDLGSSCEDISFEKIRRTFSRTLNLMSSVQSNGPTEPVLDQLNLDGIVDYIKSEKCKNIVTMAGAGISTSAGIPDFRSPGSGLYDNLQKYNLPYPQAIFELNYLMENPKPFFVLAKELYPGSFKPTVGHYFIKLLEQKGYLLRHYTQNIDTLERVAGINPEKLVEAHGTFHTSHCIDCRAVYTMAWMQERIFSDIVPLCDTCKGLVKPDIVFFGESLPSKFFDKSISDLPSCDLLIIMGSSLVVQPFASLKDRVPNNCPRLLINREKVGDNDFASLFGFGCPLNFNPETNMRDIFWEGSCDDGCQLLADKLGWGDELRLMMKQAHDLIDKQQSNLMLKKYAHNTICDAFPSDDNFICMKPSTHNTFDKAEYSMESTAIEVDKLVDEQISEVCNKIDCAVPDSTVDNQKLMEAEHQEI